MAGEELLIVDGAEKDREGLRRHFDGRGQVCTVVGTRAQARDALTQKFFPVMLVDLDVDEPSGGLELLRIVKQRSPQTTSVVLTSRRTFEGAVEAFRLGAADVIVKATEHVPRLRSAVDGILARTVSTQQGSQLHRDARSVLHDAFKVMLAQAHVVYADISAALPPVRPRVLLVDGDASLLEVLAKLMRLEGWDLSIEMSGGGALDRGSRGGLDILVVRDDLPDLRGNMVLKSLQAEGSELMGLLYGAPGPDARLDRLERGRAEPKFGPLERPEQLIDAVRRLSSELSTKAQERRLIEAFRADHADFLRRFAKLKGQIDNLVDD